MKRKKRVAIGCSIVSTLCFGIVSYGHFYRGRIELGCIFAILTAVQLVLAVINNMILKKIKSETDEEEPS